MEKSDDAGFIRVYRPKRKALLLRRGNKADGIIQARIRRPDGKGYKFISMETTDWTTAFRFAAVQFRRLREQHRNDIPLDVHRFEFIYKKWLESRKSRLSEKRHANLVWMAERYFYEFFNKLNFALIDENTVERYWEWRMNYWVSGPGSKKVSPFATPKPKMATLAVERDALNQVFRWAVRHQYLRRQPQIELPEKYEKTRRPAYPINKFHSFYKDAQAWMRETEREYDRYHRALSVYFCSLILFSGLRPREAKLLKWQDVKTFKDESGNEHILLTIHPETKTHGREMVPLDETAEVLREWHAFAKHTGPDDYVFANWDGSFWEAHGRSVHKLLTHLGARKDNFGRDLSAYSFRHAYATHRLLNGVRVYSLAENMGTSVEMIERHYSHVKPRMNAEELTKMTGRDRIVVPEDFLVESKDFLALLEGR